MLIARQCLIPSSPFPSSSSQVPLYGFFDKAFANEDLGPQKNAGLKNGPKMNDNVSINGKACKNVVVGQKISQVANAARVKIGEAGERTARIYIYMYVHN